jgi:hypothetical protein
MEDLLVDLKVKWEELTSASFTWLAHLESKSTGSDKDTKQLKDLLSSKKFVLTNFDRQVRQANPTTPVEQRDVATMAKTYLDTTEAVHFDFTERSKGDATANQSATDVQEKREAVYAQVKLIHDIPLIPDRSSNASASNINSSTTTTLGSSNGGRKPLVAAGGAVLSGPPSDISNQPLLLVLLSILNGGVNAAVIVQTKALFAADPNNPPQFTVTDSMQKLFKSWDDAVTAFAGQFANLDDNPTAIAGLLELHFELETLYGQLSSLVSETDEDSLFSVY